MTREEIEKMPAGEKMNNLIATRVMGYELLGYPAIPKWQKPSKDGVQVMFTLPDYSGDVSAAMQILGRQLGNHIGPIMLHSLRECAKDKGGWEAIFCSDFGYTQPAYGETAALAICRCALATVESK
jgi:hypothetical protein